MLSGLLAGAADPVHLCAVGNILAEIVCCAPDPSSFTPSCACGASPSAKRVPFKPTSLTPLLECSVSVETSCDNFGSDGKLVLAVAGDEVTATDGRQDVI